MREKIPVGFIKAAECLGILAHPARLRLTCLLLEESRTVRELAEACGLPPNTTSEHLRLMQVCGFLSSSKKGRFTYYRVIEPHLKDLMKCISKRFLEKEAA